MILYLIWHQILKNSRRKGSEWSDLTKTYGDCVFVVYSLNSLSCIVKYGL